MFECYPMTLKTREIPSNPNNNRQSEYHRLSKLISNSLLIIIISKFLFSHYGWYKRSRFLFHFFYFFLFFFLLLLFFSSSSLYSCIIFYRHLEIVARRRAISRGRTGEYIRRHCSHKFVRVFARARYIKLEFPRHLQSACPAYVSSLSLCVAFYFFFSLYCIIYIYFLFFYF